MRFYHIWLLFYDYFDRYCGLNITSLGSSACVDSFSDHCGVCNRSGQLCLVCVFCSGGQSLAHSYLRSRVFKLLIKAELNEHLSRNMVIANRIEDLHRVDLGSFLISKQVLLDELDDLILACALQVIRLQDFKHLIRLHTQRLTHKVHWVHVQIVVSGMIFCMVLALEIHRLFMLFLCTCIGVRCVLVGIHGKGVSALAR